MELFEPGNRPPGSNIDDDSHLPDSPAGRHRNLDKLRNEQGWDVVYTVVAEVFKGIKKVMLTRPANPTDYDMGIIIATELLSFWQKKRPGWRSLKHDGHFTVT
jgi:hypothetical protein